MKGRILKHVNRISYGGQVASSCEHGNEPSGYEVRSHDGYFSNVKSCILENICRHFGGSWCIQLE
jgi:hypothetical protein